ncbi:hypothetical protein Goklo_006411 [Gossypium klotzschianum]|uniref:2-C-methyl-D-erythritol 4-phosphate cytidylyltransferase n=1 Tax=Gossypium klotzschianum TaxID=34286 RepID=A0A7J8VHH0_9ROSI|nr:hypothetical protein [Gossypium klotzschianum]
MGLLLFNNAPTCTISTQFFPTKSTHVTANSFPSFPHFHVSFPSSGQKVGLRRRARVRTYGIKCSAKVDYVKVLVFTQGSAVVNEKSVSVILLAGGKGKRMGVSIYSYSFNCASMPKQYLPLLGQPIALHSLYTFSRMIEVKEIVVVCDPSYKDIFEGLSLSLSHTHTIYMYTTTCICMHIHAFCWLTVFGQSLPQLKCVWISSGDTPCNMMIFVAEAKDKINVDLKFTLPGKERQDSVYSGLQAVDLNSELVCIHDSARPLVRSGDVEKVWAQNICSNISCS